MDAIRNLRQVKNNWHTCSQWELAQRRDEARFEVFKNNIDKNGQDASIFANRGKTLIDAINTMDQTSINKSENAMLSIRTASNLGVTAFGALGAIFGGLLSILRKSPTGTPKMAAFIGYTAFTLIGVAISSFINSHFTKTATRVARYQTRNNEMQDVRNFVTYTDEQIAKAKEKLSSVGAVKDKAEDISWKESSNPIKAFKKSFEDIKVLNQDYSSYKNWHSKYSKQEAENAKNPNGKKLTEAERIEAEKDKNFVLKTIKKLELSANNYEMNIGFAVRTAAVALSLLSVGGGFFMSWGLGRMSNSLAKGFLSSALNYGSKLSIPAGLLSMIFLVGPLTKLTKDAAQLGRFKAQKELLSDEKNFYPHTDKDLKDIKLENAQDIKNQTLLEKFKNNFKFLFEIKKDYKEYLAYKNNQRQEDLKLAQVLKDTPISKEQLLDAKKLQQQTFMSFEKIDEKSESLVDDTDAAVSTTSAIINSAACCLANIFTLKYFGKIISQFTKTKSMPGFFEGLKLAKNLSLKNMAMIFILPYVITRGVILLTSLFGTEVKKKACKIGVMSAMNDLNHSQKFASTPEKLLFKEFKTN